ncbi:hypothetical protein B0H11DRAFT_1925888 [Mycena galericulata]|nr:hypothetical protein B0H11DRAFT_1925888 [Mycena galericulata]
MGGCMAHRSACGLCPACSLAFGARDYGNILFKATICDEDEDEDGRGLRLRLALALASDRRGGEDVDDLSPETRIYPDRNERRGCSQCQCQWRVKQSKVLSEEVKTSTRRGAASTFGTEAEFAEFAEAKISSQKKRQSTHRPVLAGPGPWTWNLEENLRSCEYGNQYSNPKNYSIQGRVKQRSKSTHAAQKPRTMKVAIGTVWLCFSCGQRRIRMRRISDTGFPRETFDGRQAKGKGERKVDARTEDERTEEESWSR